MNDVKNSLSKACKGVFLQAQLHSSYLWSLAYRPFGSGAYLESKTRLLEVMLSNESAATCPMFQDSWREIRTDLQMDPSSSRETVWEALASCPTFVRKLTLPKLSRWFSWNDSAEQQMPEFRVLKLVLSYHFKNEKIDPDLAEEQRILNAAARDAQKKGGDVQQMRREFSKLKEQLGGGPKLAYYCMTERLWFHCSIIQLVTRPCWDWYATSVKTCKNADHSLDSAIALQSDWCKLDHLRALAGIPTSQDPVLVRLLGHPTLKDAAEKVTELTWHLLRMRCSSLSKHSSPPDCYAAVLSLDPLNDFERQDSGSCAKTMT